MKPARGSALFLFSVLFLFFFQLISDFIEATYVFGLLGTGMPIEAITVLLLLSPIVLLWARRGLSGWALVFLGELMLVCRVIEPLLDTRGRMMLAGLGVACFMILLPALILREGTSKETHGLDLGLGLTCSLSLSILLRVLGSGSDLSTAGMFQSLAWLLGLIAGVQILSFLRSTPATALGCQGQDTRGDERPSRWRIIGLGLGVISVLILLYFSFISPNVIARWTGANYLFTISITVLALGVFATLVALVPDFFAALTPRIVLIWNMVFVLSMVLTILSHQIQFPADAGSYPLAEPPVSWLHHVPLVATLVLFPVILVDFIILTQDLRDRRPSSRTMGAAFTLAALFFLVMIFAQIFSTVYDYIPVVGPLFRDRFWLVYLLPGIALTLSLLLAGKSSFGLFETLRSQKTGPLFPGIVIVLSLITVAGVPLTAANPGELPGQPTTLTILTYNIQQGYSEAGLKNYDGQLDVIRQAKPDLIGLQESDTSRLAGGNADLVRYFADRLDMYSYYGPKTVPGTFGIALLSRYPIQNPSTFYMYSEGEQTATIEAQVSAGEKTFNVFVTHLGNGGPIVQMEAILKEVEGKENIIAIGDFNFRPNTDQYRLTTQALEDAWILRWPQGVDQGVDPAERIDHTFVSPGMTILDAQYLPSSESDHPAMIVVIAW